MIDFLNRLSEPDTLLIIFQILIAVLYLTGRITKAQFMTEQESISARIRPTSKEKKEMAVDNTLGPIAVVLDVADHIPVINTKLPIVNDSVPGIVRKVLGAPVGILSDLLMNMPLFGSKVVK